MERVAETLPVRVSAILKEQWVCEGFNRPKGKQQEIHFELKVAPKSLSAERKFEERINR